MADIKISPPTETHYQCHKQGIILSVTIYITNEYIQYDLIGSITVAVKISIL